MRVDGGDVLAVYEATREAVARARAGEGPTFIEAVSLPRRAARDRRRSARVHRPRAGRGGERRECLGRFEGYLRRAGVLSDEVAEAVRAEAAELMREGIARRRGRAAGRPRRSLFEHAYVDPPASFEDDLAELRRVLGG